MSRDINDLCPAVRQKCLELLDKAREAGINFIVVQTLRTEAEQLALFAQGRKAVAEVNRLRHDAGMGPITEEQNKRPVTWELTSMHMFGCAFDVAITVAITVDGNLVWNNPPMYEKLGALGETLGLTWGGRWKVKDLGHFQYTGGLSVLELKEGKRPEA